MRVAGRNAATDSKLRPVRAFSTLPLRLKYSGPPAAVPIILDKNESTFASALAPTEVRMDMCLTPAALEPAAKADGKIKSARSKTSGLAFEGAPAPMRINPASVPNESSVKEGGGRQNKQQQKNGQGKGSVNLVLATLMYVSRDYQGKVLGATLCNWMWVKTAMVA